MKKPLAMLLCLLLVLSLAACATDEDVKGKTKKNKSESGETVSTEQDYDRDEYENEDEGDASEEYQMGATSGKTYTNEYFGFACTLDGSWTFKTEDEIKELNDFAFDYLDDEYQEAIQNASILYEMLATQNNNNSININIENPGVSYTTVSESERIESQKDALKSSLEKMGLENVQVNIETINFAGSQHAAAFVTGQVGDIEFEEIVVVVKKGYRFANIAIGTIDGTAEEILSCFKAV